MIYPLSSYVVLFRSLHSSYANEWSYDGDSSNVTWDGTIPIKIFEQPYSSGSVQCI